MDEEVLFNTREGSERYVELLKSHYKVLYDACEDPRDREYYRINFEIVEAEYGLSILWRKEHGQRVKSKNL